MLCCGDGPTRVYLGLKVVTETAVVYPDVLVTSRPLDPDDDRVFDPAVIIEVLSPSTETHDRIRKWREYQAIGSLQHFVLIAQSKRRIEVYTRAGAAWQLASSSRREMRSSWTPSPQPSRSRRSTATAAAEESTAVAQAQGMTDGQHAQATHPLPCPQPQRLSARPAWSRARRLTSIHPAVKNDCQRQLCGEPPKKGSASCRPREYLSRGSSLRCC
jgi:Putative restriction endonuclease